jgi:hypothetical protein
MTIERRLENSADGIVRKARLIAAPVKYKDEGPCQHVTELMSNPSQLPHPMIVGGTAKPTCKAMRFQTDPHSTFDCAFVYAQHST